VRLLWLRACAVTEGADVHASNICDTSASSTPDMCVAAVLGDALHRVSALRGREGMPRSLGSVYGGSVTRFLGSHFRGVVSHVFDTPAVSSWGGIGVHPCSGTVLLPDTSGGSHAVHEFDADSGSLVRVVGGRGSTPLRFNCPGQVFVAADGFVFVADRVNNRVQVLTPSLDFHGFVGAGELQCPVGVCASDDVIVVGDGRSRRVLVFNRHSGSVVARLGDPGTVDATCELRWPGAVCLVSNGQHVAFVP
jgi:hypothetical protein